MSSYVSTRVRRLVINRAEGLCEYCLINEADTYFGLQIEHIISEKHDGKSVESNLALACITCNQFKGTDIAAFAASSSRLVRLFNPRKDKWSTHFKLNGFSIIANDEIGEATLGLLKFNTSERLYEREILILCQRYPSEAARKRMTL